MDVGKWNSPSPISVVLTSDFGQRSISAQLNRDYSINGDGVAFLGVDVRGTGPITQPGSFSIPLAGSLLGAEGSAPLPVTGALDGAFFGPNAQQVGGVFAVDAPFGSQVHLVRDAFVGARN